MRLEESRRSDNVEDRRGAGGLSRTARVGGAGGLGLIVLFVIALAFGVDPTVLLQGVPEGPTGVGVPSGGPGVPAPGVNDQTRDFVAAVLGETEDVWSELFRASGRTYQPPKLVLFSGATASECGYAQGAMGPFYCPLDQKVYLDYSFFQDLHSRFGASGDFAQAYVIAHEVGHHVQTLLGVSQRVHEARQRASEREANALSVRLELQADCLAGIWANRAQSARRIMEAGDLEEAIGAAAAVGDDRIQQRTRGRVVPDSFTHGTSAQRVQWFQRGFRSGSVNVCDTFNR
jgi:predicted metalloprotease